MSKANVYLLGASAIALAGLSGCASTPEATAADAELQAYEAALAAATQPASAEARAVADRADPLTRANFWGEEYRKNPADLEVTIAFMRALRGINSHKRITEIASTAIALHPDNYELLLENGRALMALGRAEEAAISFAKSSDYAPADNPIPLAALGVAFDRLADHNQAQRAYEMALRIAPDRISTLSNYGLSLALTGDLVAAEYQLRKASEQPDADVRVRQNLALILGLQGKFDEMQAVDPGAPRRTVEANRNALMSMMGKVETYGSLEEVSADVMASAPREVQPMPQVREAQVESEAMSMPEPAAPKPAAVQATQNAELAGDKPAKPLLRPKLRGSTDG